MFKVKGAVLNAQTVTFTDEYGLRFFDRNGHEIARKTDLTPREKLRLAQALMASALNE